MTKHLLTIISIFLYLFGAAQTTASFNAPDTVCRNQNISIINTSQNGTTFKWFFCKQTPSVSLSGVNLGGTGLPTRPTVIEIAKEGANYIGFVGNNRPGGDQLYRITFGSNLLSTPVVSPMGSFGGVLTEPEGIQLFKENGNWYGIIISNNPSTYVLTKLDFGTSLNNVPVITNYGNLGGLLNSFMTELIIQYTGGNYIGFIGFDNGNLIRINFGTSITNTPTGVALGNPGGLTRVSKMGLIQRNGNWYLFVPNDGYTTGNYYIERLNFGNSLLNVPTPSNLGNPGNLLNRAYDFLPFVDCESFKGYVLSPGNSSVMEYTFPNDVASTSITGVSLGNIGVMNFPNSFSNVINYNGENYTFVPNVSNNTITRLKLSSNCQSFGVATSTATNPPTFKIDSVGTYNITLVVDENLSSETRSCKEIVVVDSIKKPDAIVNTPCVGDSIKLRINNIDNTATYAWTGPNGFTANTANANVLNATLAKQGQYIVTTTGRCGVKKDTVNVTLVIVSVNIGRDTAICQGASLVLNATTTNGSYLWSTSSTSPTITVNSPGTYSVRVTVNSCIGRDTIMVTQSLKPAAFSLGRDSTYCSTFSRVLSTGNAATTWSTGATGSQITVNSPGTYIATITNSCGSTKDTIVLSQVSCVVVTPSFNSPDTVCRDQNISIINTSQNATTYKWFFCKETPLVSLTGVNLGSAGLPSRPTVIEIAKDGANYIGLIGNNVPGGDQLYKMSFGANLLSVPVVTPMGTFGGLLTEPEGIQLFRENGNWFAIIVSNNPSTYVMTRLDFGSSLNNVPTVTSYGNLGGLLNGFMTELIIQNTGSGYIGFVGFDNGNLIRLNFGSSITNTPTGTALGNPGGLTRVSKMGLIFRNGGWYLFVPNDGYTNGNYYIERLNFGNSLLNAPTATNLGNPGNLLNRAYDFLPFVDCESFKGYVLSPGNSTVIEYTFPNDVSSTSITGVSLGNIGTLNFPNSFSNVINYSGENYTFVPNINSSTITRLKLSSNCQSFGVPTSTATNPPVFNIDSVGTYNVTLIADENLSSEARLCKEIVVIDSIKKPDARINVINCTTDSIRLTIANIDPLATYAWTGPNGFTSTKANVSIKFTSPTQAGQYIVTATGRCGIKKDTVIANISTVSVNLGRDTGICQGNSLTLNATTANATYLWSTGATSPTITVSTAGTYSVRVTVNGCVALDTIVVSILSAPAPFSLGKDTTYCGPFTRVLSTGNATTTWSTGATGAQITVTQTGTYIATIANSCGSVKDTIVITGLSAPATFSLGRDTAYCGSFTRILSTGNATTTWSTGATGAQITVTQPGTYIATITNVCGTKKDTIVISTLNGPAPFSLGRDTSYCGAFTRVLSTGNATTTWSNGATGAQITVTTPGTYIATISNTCGSVKDTIVITGLNAPSAFSLGNDTSYCVGFTRILSTGNATTTWSTGATGSQITVTQPGTYIATITNQCGTRKDTIVISTINGPSAFTIGRDTTYCGAFTRVLSTGNPTTTWSTGATGSQITVSTPGTYIATISNTCGSVKDTIVLKGLNAPAAFSLGNDTAYCGNFTRVLSTGNATTTWSTGATGSQITVTQPGTYVATITNQCGTKKDTIVINQNAAPVVSLGRDTALCTGAQLVLNATTNNATYVWSTTSTSPTITVSTPGSYSVAVTVNSCTGRDTINITQIQKPAAFHLGNDTTYCGNFTRVLSTGNASTVWSTGVTASQITVTQPGTYIATITNTCGSTKDTIVLQQNTVPVVSLGRDTTICQGSNLTLNATTANASYLWNTGDTTPTISVSQQGNYSVKVTAGGCSASDNINVSVQNPPAAFFIGNDTAYCGSVSRILSTGNPATVWSTGVTASQIPVSQQGVYYATISNQCGSKSDTIGITVHPFPVISLGPDVSICQGTSQLLDATTPNATYLWNTGATTAVISVTNDSLYWVQVTVNGCSRKDSINVTVNPLISPFDLGDDTTYCGPFVRTLSVGNQNALWSTGAHGPQITVSQAGKYTALVSNTCGSILDSITLLQFSVPPVSLGKDTFICNGSIELRISNTNVTSILWSTGENTPVISVSDADVYWVRVTDANTCSNADTIHVSDDCIADIFIPNAFTPNGDGTNDVFIPLSNSKFVQIDKMLIFDRWGEELYRVENFNIMDKQYAWNGTYKGEKCQLDTYVYYIEMSFNGGKEIIKKKYKGTVTLIR